jgi:hypothetical protein
MSYTFKVDAAFRFVIFNKAFTAKSRNIRITIDVPSISDSLAEQKREEVVEKVIIISHTLNKSELL